MRHEPRKTQRQAPKPKPRRPTPRPSPPAHPFLSPLHRCQTTTRRQTGDTGCQGRPTKEPSLPANSTPNRRDPAYTPAYTPRQPPCPEPRKPLILRHADPPNGKLQPLCPGRLLPISSGIQSSPSALSSARIAAGISLESASLGRSIGASTTVR